MQYTISALVTNKSGVLTKISGLFSRRGFNIESLSVCKTEDPLLSRMTIVLNGDDYTLGQMVKQMDKLIEVKKIMPAVENESIYRELLLIKVSAAPEIRNQIVEIKEIYKAKVVDLSPNSMILELTGEPNKLDGFIRVIQPYGILEMARTGVTAISRGEKCIKDVVSYEEFIL
ncbi:MAG: acetolactate synthase small subunit [Clostridia bacterium]|nr:acetolactate synthase small subunit [Clostridia bacterium]